MATEPDADQYGDERAENFQRDALPSWRRGGHADSGYPAGFAA
jgi:hypothetical protein